MIVRSFLSPSASTPSFDVRARQARGALVLVGCAAVLLYPELVNAASNELVGSIVPITNALRGFVRLLRVISMFVFVIIGTTIGAQYYVLGRGNSYVLEKYVSSVAMVFLSSAFLDAIMGLTVGNAIIKMNPVVIPGFND